MAKKDTKKDKSKETINDSGILFKVQIAASHKLVKKNYFKKFNIQETVHIELHEGWHKYTIGNSDYNSY